MTLAAMLSMPFTCRANLSDCTNQSILNPFIREWLTEISPHAAGLECKTDTDACKREGGPRCRPSFQTRWSVIRREAENETSGLGSSHTTPCGAAVPARPPTRPSNTTHLHCAPQWVSRATRRGTRVVVQRATFSSRQRSLNSTKVFLLL
jgi:hypothetical protein